MAAQRKSTAKPKPKAFAADLEAIRSLATHLLRLAGHEIPMEWTEWEIDFLEAMAERATDEPLSEAQQNKLRQLERLAELQAKVDGLSVTLLISSCALEADHLSEDDDRAFILWLREMGRGELRRRDVARLLRCCRELGVIEPHHGFADAA